MEVVFFHWASSCGYSITRSFAPLIKELKKSCAVKEYRVPYAGANPVNLLRNILFVRRHRTKTGINHVTGDIHYCILGLIGVKSVLTIHDDYAYKQARFGLIGRCYKWLFWVYLPIKWATAVLCVSDATRQAITGIYNSPKPQVLSNHTWPAVYHYYPKKPGEEFVVLHISTGANKNLETTLRALKGLPTKLVVVEQMQAHQIRLAEELQINYVNTGRISDRQMLSLYKQADIVAFPSSYEGFGMPIVEAQLIGRVVITTNKPPMSHVAGTGAYYLNNPQDSQEMRHAFLTLMSDAALRERLIKAGQENAKRFSVEQVGKRFVSLYAELLPPLRKE